MVLVQLPKRIWVKALARTGRSWRVLMSFQIFSGGSVAVRKSASWLIERSWRHVSERPRIPWTSVFDPMSRRSSLGSCSSPVIEWIECVVVLERLYAMQLTRLRRA
ncbi:hypothetical protein CC86DRAFT_73066 [Ophiobolus disseminans]|uniref:Uncharacterized protein n=1 Tax=Ophiobolus disseminans TaxID=1469910 RepID=A0A6A6ZPT4_9PLEO|nr:hypothetical protein CC86DRAFT_73066 [Ophiobolus disseminans]